MSAFFVKKFNVEKLFWKLKILKWGKKLFLKIRNFLSDFFGVFNWKLDDFGIILKCINLKTEILTSKNHKIEMLT